MNQFHQSNYQQQSVLTRDLNRGVQEKWLPSGCPVGDTPPIGIVLEENWMEKASPTNPHVPSPDFLHILTRWPPATPELHKTSASSVGLHKFKV